MKILQRVAVRLKQSPPSDHGGRAAPNAPSAVLLTLLAARALLHGQIDTSARDGVVADALPLSLLDNHQQELTERRRQLSQAQQDLQTCVTQLDCMFEAAVPPPPEPPPPRPARLFRRISQHVGRRHQPGPLH
jgi:hypothetical protein